MPGFTYFCFYLNLWTIILFFQSWREEVRSWSYPWYWNNIELNEIEQQINELDSLLWVSTSIQYPKQLIQSEKCLKSMSTYGWYLGWRFLTHYTLFEIILCLVDPFERTSYFPVTKRRWKKHKISTTLK